MSDMQMCSFTLIVSGFDHEADGFEDALFEAGCDDATVSVQRGLLMLDFQREAAGLARAIKSAIADVRKAGGDVIHVEPDNLVNTSDIAARTAMTRQAVHNWVAGKRGDGFPHPVARVTSDHPLWDWAIVADWLSRRQLLPRREKHAARIVRGINRRLRRDAGEERSAA
jgi:hypothetical protein